MRGRTRCLLATIVTMADSPKLTSVARRCLMPEDIAVYNTHTTDVLHRSTAINSYACSNFEVDAKRD